MNKNKKKFINKTLKPSMDWICYDDNQKIREVSEVLVFPLTEEDKQAIAKMISYIDACYYDEFDQYKIRAGIAIAGVQIHYLKKVAYIHLNDEEDVEHEYLIANPHIIFESYTKGYVQGGEGCLSVEIDKYGLVPRSYHIKVKATNVFNQKSIEIEAKGILAICLQHEIDHLNGRLYYDKINLFNPDYIEEDWIKI